MPISRYIEDPLFSKDEWVATFTTTDVKWENDLSTNQYILSNYVPSKHFNLPSKHFNCPFCGAPNQIDVCEYCGSAYEGDNE